MQPYQSEVQQAQNSERPPSELKQIIQNYTSRHSEQYIDDGGKAGGAQTVGPAPTRATDTIPRQQQVIQSEKCKPRRSSISPSQSGNRGALASRQSNFSYVNTDSYIEKTNNEGKEDQMRPELLGAINLQPSNTSLAFHMSEQLITPQEDPEFVNISSDSAFLCF